MAGGGEYCTLIWYALDLVGFSINNEFICFGDICCMWEV